MAISLDSAEAADDGRVGQRKDVSIIIPTYNRERFLSVCLDCLIAQDYPADKYEIVVVDDASTDGTEEMVRAKKATCRIRYERQAKTMGNGAAKNRGVYSAEGEVIIFIDSDAYAPPWYVREYMKTHEAHPNSIVDGPAISIHDDRLVSDPPLNTFGVRALAALDFFGQPFVNANASCLREDFIKIGGFDENFKKWQDLELYQRLMELGLKRFRNRNAYVLHYEAGRDTLLDKARHMKSKGQYAAMFYGKHPSAWARRKTRLRYLTYDRMFDLMGWTERYLADENFDRSEQHRGLWYGLLTRLYIIHSYAEGLRTGMALRGTGAGSE